MFLLPSVMVLVSAQAATPVQERADRFLDLVNSSYKALTYVASKAQWDAATDVTPAHDAATEAASQAMAAFTGNPALITEAKALLERKAELTPITVRQLERVLLERGRRADDEPEAGLGSHRRGDAAGLHPQQLRLQARREADHRQRDRRHPARTART